MPRSKQNRNAGARREAGTRPAPPELPPLALWFMREILPLLRRRRQRNSESARHLRKAGIEVLEAMRAFLDEAIECLQKEEGDRPLRRIEVQD